MRVLLLVLRRAAAATLVCLAIGATAQTPSASVSSCADLWVEPNAGGFEQLMRRLKTTGRIMQITAHPDDEDGGGVTREARGKGHSVLLMTLTRGEGGQNIKGAALLDELGLLRTLELLAADRYYGAEQRFSRMADFGFSKSADETLRIWDREKALEDIVRVIRMWKPDVIAAGFSGTPRDGHGHHQASGILAREAYDAAADPNRFPEMIKQGLLPWQAKKFYVRQREGEPDVQFETTENDAALGMTYAEWGVRGLRMQESQGMEGVRFQAGTKRFARYKLVDSKVQQPAGVSDDFFGGIDTSLVGLAALSKDTSARARLEAAQHEIDAAATAGWEKRTEAGMALLRANLTLSGTLGDSPALRTELDTERCQIQQAANLALGVDLKLPGGHTTTDQHPAILTAEQELRSAFEIGGPSGLTAKSVNVAILDHFSDVEPKRKFNVRSILPGSGQTHGTIQLRTEEGLGWTRPYWTRNDPYRDTLFEFKGPAEHFGEGLPSPVRVSATYKLKDVSGTIAAPFMIPFRDAEGHETSAPLFVGPRYSLTLSSYASVLSLARSEPLSFSVTLQKYVPGASTGTLKIGMPKGWPAVEPIAVQFAANELSKRVPVTVPVGKLRAGTDAISFTFESGGRKFDQTITFVGRDEIGYFPYYHPATQTVSVVDVNVPRGLKVGYVMGAGDEIADVLRQLGMDVSNISDNELKSGDLSKYGTIVVGIRAYDAREGVRANNARLLEYVNNGGRLLVQYNTETQQWNSGKFSPFPITIGRDRVSVEQAPIEVLAPQDALFTSPNKITAADFDAWVQERGLYFPNQWAPEYEALLESHDPGEQPLKGGLLRAKVGKGTYILTTYSFFRQLPAGVPGAVRLFVNLVAGQ